VPQEKAPEKLWLKRRALPPPPDLDVSPFALGPPNARTACLLIHGFSGSPAEMRGLGEYLAERGVRVEGVGLAGHGTDPAHLRYLTWRDWLHTAAEGLERARHGGRRVTIAGFSMGGLLGLHLCLANPNLVSRIVTMSSPIFFRDRRIHLIPVAQHIWKWHQVKRVSHNRDPQAHTRYVSYRRYPLVAVDRLLNLMRATRRILPKVETPALVMHGLHDRVIHPRSALYIHRRIGSREKELVWWRNSGHGLVFDSEREDVWARVHEFIEREEPRGA
jgi:carboxylesterase